MSTYQSQMSASIVIKKISILVVLGKYNIKQLTPYIVIL